MPEPRVTLIVGASGAAAQRILTEGRAQARGPVIGLSRHAPAGMQPWVTADLTDPAGLRTALAARADITHIVYASRAPFGEGGVEDVDQNLAMLRHLVEAAEDALPHLAHIHLVQGCKWYGMHIGPFRTPAREEDPRHLPPNFYYDQQDCIADRQRGRAWAWSASRPNFVLDVAPGRARNLVSTLGAYAAICRETGTPFDFPGKPGTWDALHEVTDATLLAEGVLWMLDEPRCANRAFNITNGDAIRWRHLWPDLAARFGVAPGTVRTMPLARWMADKAPVWEAIRARHGLRLPIEQVAAWDFADFVFGLDYDMVFSMNAARTAGFAGFRDTPALIASQIEGYRAARILP